MKRTLTGLVLIAMFAPMPALAKDRDRDDRPYTVTRDEALAIAFDHGMADVYETERDDGVWEIEGRNAAGEKLEVEIDGQTGEVMKMETYGADDHGSHGEHHSGEHH